MFSLRLRFQTVASKLKISDLNAPDLNEEHLLEVATKYCQGKLRWAKGKRYDLSDYLILWEIIGIDNIITLENQEGQSLRVAITLRESESKAQSIFYDLKSKQRASIRQELNIDQHWVIAVKWKNFPEEDEWIDILYREIDDDSSSSDCRLIIL
ncbi:hypothetical protein VKI21_08905 [Cyanobacterium aponinum UTEX 3222]|uniref:Uncharacterized protein n=3 Tax=Cyanobacterium aponinum TaxID=379064 RepID=K9Z693_CYAAP|nr:MULTISPECIES: hypothetical protein [Cyanobacterium]RMD68851.1 MAG: hypothetical protein D6822_06320 [Cyanobacteria bacterium J149]WRL43793.1 hypothetical protein VKI21_08905 [Cyanobacterium aponinum UTEX 3222]AFZ54252.1 hypothetical protein Cyan10605_2166 [Cyanobacterium aponinum PCC 10605]MBD2393859.1 hypothetical protein [Cyanobacterium aponinum FACHB-4101]MTF39602.1 hypothetical protein [Cyanobacterium aponinum 0216]